MMLVTDLRSMHLPAESDSAGEVMRELGPLVRAIAVRIASPTGGFSPLRIAADAKKG